MSLPTYQEFAEGCDEHGTAWPLVMRDVMRKKKLTGSDVARIVGVNSRTVRSWLSPAGTAHHSRLPYAVMLTLLYWTKGNADE